MSRLELDGKTLSALLRRCGPIAGGVVCVRRGRVFVICWSVQ